MALNCDDIEPFRYPSTPQKDMDSGESGAQINDQAIEQWLERLRQAVCADLASLEARIEALEP